VKRLTTVIAVAIVTFAVLLVPGQAQAVTASRYAQQAVHSTNVHRHAHHLRTLKVGACLRKHAARQAQRMANQHRMFHQALKPVLRDCGLTVAGENVAYGFTTGWAVVNKGWMHSAPHRHNILDKRFGYVGIAARRDSRGVWYVSQVLGRH